MLALIGLPGSGKSTVGRQLARRLALPILDTDRAIEESLGVTIREFFEREGEQRFRDLETKTLDHLTCQPDGILATGGGVVLRPANRLMLRQRALVFYLKADPQDIFHRLRHDKLRPLLQGGDALQRLLMLHEQRDPLYLEIAHHVIETHNQSIYGMVRQILRHLPTPPEP